MQKKKILHLISGLDIGGTETQLLRVLPELQIYHENYVCCVRGHGPIGKQLEKKGVPVQYLEFKNILDLGVIYRFYKSIEKIQPDILVTYLIHADLYGRVFGRLFGVKKIVSSKRGSLLQWEWLSFFDKLTKCLVTHYLVQTEVAKNEWMKKLNLFDEKKFTIIPNGINAKQFSVKIDKGLKRQEISIPTNSFVISCISRLRIGKGHKYLLEAFESVYKTNKNSILLIVGDGEKEITLKEQIKSYSSKNAVKFLGNRSDIPEILAITDVFVLPTEKEGMSNAIIEAMTSGVPVITTDIKENHCLIKNGLNGILFRKNSALSLEKKLKLLQTNQMLRKQLSARAKEEALRNFNVTEIALRLSQIYETL